jgi:cellulose synthase/poly-beta-1,6-N-acetylglucosamine synthase-like glycosyltransferase
MEWDVPPGEASQVGGIFMARRTAFEGVGGFREQLTAGEEPDLCARLIQAGWRIVRLDEDMALHDAGITRFGQWWRRCVRGGHAAMQNWSLAEPMVRAHSRGMVLRALAWGLALPLVAICAGVVLAALGRWTGALAVLVAVAFLLALQVLRVASYKSKAKGANAHASLFAIFNLISKVPEAQGVLQYALNSLVGRRTPLVDYKQSPGNQAQPDR